MSSKDLETELLVSLRDHKSVQWKIKNFVNVISGNSTVLFSPKFTFAKTRFFLEISNLNSKSVGDDSISLFLHAHDPSSSGKEFDYAMGIRKPDGSVFKSIKGVAQFANCNVGKGVFVKKFSRVRNTVIAADCSLTFFCTLTCGEKEEAAFPEVLEKEVALPENVAILLKTFKELYISGLHSDIKIKVKDREFQAHKCVLSTRSPVFASMFQNEMTGKSSSVVQITDCDEHCFESFLLFMYTGDVSSVSLVNAVSLYKIAEKYQMKDLKNASAHFLKSHLRVEAICDIVHLAIVHDEAELLTLATNFFIKNSNRVLKTPQWKAFLVESPAMANELFIQMATRHCTPK